MIRKEDLLEPLSVEQVCRYGQELMDDESLWAWVLVQEPTFVGLGVVTPGELHLQRNVDWIRLTDLRIFSPKGEWHFWQQGKSRWAGRLRLTSTEQDVIFERHRLWGTRVASASGGWWVAQEQRGIKVYIPARITQRDLPLCLEVCQVVDYQGDTRLAYVVDAFLTGLTTARGEPLSPALAELKGGSRDVRRPVGAR